VFNSSDKKFIEIRRSERKFGGRTLGREFLRRFLEALKILRLQKWQEKCDYVIKITVFLKFFRLVTH